MYSGTTFAPINVSNINFIPMLNGTNFKTWKDKMLLFLGLMNLDLALLKEQPSPLNNESSSEIKEEYERWERSNRLSLLIMKNRIPEAYWSTLSHEKNAKKFLEELEKLFATNEKVEISALVAKLMSMKYKGRGHIWKYIMEMCNVISKLNALKINLPEEFLMHLILISLPVQYNQFRMRYCQKDKWTFNELVYDCVQEEERLNALNMSRGA
ncbi:uncharacterized protein LOC133819667 [Humulus lupulus]|uniref:uncharacterized protein LOC133819667 n=1 Tax=Humulus lupulus TaxID=3486 RepID=UPI002B40EF7C|nr:uncharacterized protein LOC133819667 [Humulus lupulus]XP_062108952.1 uncharacterized protein LOC133819667 [Humulus lupulus]XP_062108953.1 uncharacterized protein LOC133819667 [Humulus lupulus]